MIFLALITRANQCSNFWYTVHRTYSAIARACTEVDVKSVKVCIDFEKDFSQLISKHLDEQLRRWKLLIGTTLQQSFIIFWKWKIQFLPFLHVLTPQMRRKRFSWGLILVSMENPCQISYCALKLLQYIKRLTHTSTE